MSLITLALTVQLLGADVDAQGWFETDCAVKTIAYEARGESERGQRAVAEVLMNRLNTVMYPDSVCEVIVQDNQFEWYARERAGLLPKLTDEEYVSAARIWFSYLYDYIEHPVLEPCHTTFINPTLVKKRRGYLPGWWTKGTRPLKIGNHEFRCEPRVVVALNSRK